MLGFIVRRTLLAFFTAWAISIIAFFIIQAPPGDYIDVYENSLNDTRRERPGDELLKKTLRQQ